MRRRLGRRSGAAAAMLLASLVVLPAAPASATPVITIDSPPADAVLQSASVTVSGKATTELALYTIKRITLSLNGKQTTVDCTEATCPFRWAQSLPLNGPYELKVTAVDGLPVLAVDGSATEVRAFKMAAPAARPVMDPPKVTAGRSIDLSWSRNTEPDMLHYLVTRTDPAGNKSLPVRVPHPTTGSKVTLSDTTTSELGAGAYSYQVEAVRKGATGTEQSQVKSEPSGAVSATLPAIPTTTTTPLAPGAPAAGPTTTAKATAPGGVDLSGFLTSRSQPTPLPTITVPEPPDTGFSGSLPFGGRPPSLELEEGDAEAVPPRDSSSGSVISLDGGRPLVPVAGGLVLLLLALHLRLLGRRVKAAPDRDLPVELVRQAPVAVTPEPVVEVKRPTAVYDVMSDDDDEWAPVAQDVDWDQEPEPVAVQPQPPRHEMRPDRERVAAAPAPRPAAIAAPEPVPVPVPVPVIAPEPVPVPVPVPVAVSPEPVVVAGPEPEPATAAPEPTPEPVALTPEPEPVAFTAAVEPAPEPDEAEAAPEIITLWAPPAPVEAPEPDEPDPDEILIVEVVSSSRRRLVRAGGR